TLTAKKVTHGHVAFVKHVNPFVCHLIYLQKIIDFVRSCRFVQGHALTDYFPSEHTNAETVLDAPTKNTADNDAEHGQRRFLGWLIASRAK
ncbi:MAG: hypothetical protein ACI4JG_10715, partial [Acutalibacteraceae bacterium]